ncbi:MAG: ECF transporter S component [Candidatus Bathyarchaeota archaeon]|nr:ECF transporter S component [Candidatus Bathyarchaeota archaeon]
MKSLKIAAFALNAALYVVAGILFYSVLPLSFGPVRFWPQAVVPAVFAVAFGPWVGGLGAALGIFLNDLLLGGNPLLSLMAGVTSNFVGFWLLGYIANKKVAWLNSMKSYIVGTALFAVLLLTAYFYTDIMYVYIVAASYAMFLAVALLSKKWQSYEIGSVIGLLVGSAIIGVMVPLYLQYFAPTVEPLTMGGIFAYTVWTFATEIPFMLVLGPPILSAIYRAFPNLKPKDKPGEQQ